MMVIKLATTCFGLSNGCHQVVYLSLKSLYNMQSN